jgi:hypothetical protein
MPRDPQNPYETSARQAKAYRLVTEIERVSESVSPAIRLDWVQNLSDEDWSRLADLAAVRPPSEKTRALVLSALEQRAVAA